MKYVKTALCILSAAGLIITILLTCVDHFAFQRSFFEKQYQKLNTAQDMDMSKQDLMRATDVLLDYLKDERDDISLQVVAAEEKVEMFNERETAHMVDVKNLYQGAMQVRFYAFLITLVAFALLFWKARKDLLFALCYRYVQCAIAAVVIAGVLGLWIMSDFTTFWTNFHRLFFSNDLWLLNPATDRMIQMFPEPFFFAMVSRIVLAFAIVFLTLFGLSLYYLKHVMKKQKGAVYAQDHIGK